jgi:hypothetical protein
VLEGYLPSLGSLVGCGGLVVPGPLLRSGRLRQLDSLILVGRL